MLRRIPKEQQLEAFCCLNSSQPVPCWREIWASTSTAATGPPLLLGHRTTLIQDTQSPERTLPFMAVIFLSCGNSRGEILSELTRYQGRNALDMCPVATSPWTQAPLLAMKLPGADRKKAVHRPSVLHKHLLVCHGKLASGLRTAASEIFRRKSFKPVSTLLSALSCEGRNSF